MKKKSDLIPVTPKDCDGRDILHIMADLFPGSTTAQCLAAKQMFVIYHEDHPWHPHDWKAAKAINFAMGIKQPKQEKPKEFFLVTPQEAFLLQTCVQNANDMEHWRQLLEIFVRNKMEQEREKNDTK